MYPLNYTTCCKLQVIYYPSGNEICFEIPTNQSNQILRCKKTECIKNVQHVKGIQFILKY